MSGEVTPLLRCHHITDPCNNAISLHKYLSRRSQMVAAKCWDFCCCLDVTLSIVLCNAIMSRVESKDSSIRPRFRYPPHNLRGGQLSTSNIVSQSHSAASLPHLLSVEDTEGRSPSLYQSMKWNRACSHANCVPADGCGFEWQGYSIEFAEKNEALMCAKGLTV